MTLPTPPKHMDRLAPNGRKVADNFAAWFRDSVLVDDSGNPLVVYHGTARPDPCFRPNRGGNTGGIYFTPRASEACKHAEMDAEIDSGAPYVIPAYLSIRKPKVFVESIESQEFTTEQMREWASQGFDAVIGMTSDGRIIEIAAFRLNQIKSAIGNSGLYAVFSDDQVDRKPLCAAAAAKRAARGPRP